MIHMAMDVGETETPALKFVSEAFVVNAQQVEQGGVEVVNMHLVFAHDVGAEGVGFPIDPAALDAAAAVAPSGTLAALSLPQM